MKRAAATTFALALTLASSASARAQRRLEPPEVPASAAPKAAPPAPPPSTPAPEPAPAAEEPAAAPAPSTPTTDADRLDDIEQMVRISARKHELLEEEAAKRKAEGPLVTADDKGFSIKVPDSFFLLRIRGLLQGDGRFFVNDDVAEANDTFLVRRFRPSLDGTLFGFADFRFVPELAGTPQVLDGYVDLRPFPWLRLRVGKFKAPIGLERLQSDADLPIIERALDQNLSSQRDVGVTLWGDVAGGLFNYTLGIVNGAADTTSADTDLNHAKDFVARVFFQPFKAEALRDFGVLGIGFAAQTGNRKGRLPTAVSGLPIPSVAAQTGLSGFRTAGQNTFFSYYAPATDTTGALTTFAHERATRINPQLYYYYDNVGFLAEYIRLWQGVQRGAKTTTLVHQAAHVTVTYTLNGREGFDGVTPLVAFDPAKRAWGALQLAARWSWIEVDGATLSDPNVSGTGYADALRSARSARSFAGGIAWVPRRSIRLSFDFEQTRFRGGAGTAIVPATPGVPATPAVVTDRKTENVFIGRAQVNF